jgi:hypothetical protein
MRTAYLGEHMLFGLKSPQLQGLRSSDLPILRGPFCPTNHRLHERLSTTGCLHAYRLFSI